VPADPREVIAWLDERLRIGEIDDYPGALNGLQVEGTRPVARIGAAVDASRRTVELAVDDACDLLLVHHGLLWGGPFAIVGAAYERIAPLIRAGTGLYSAHLPLDVHPEIGNNVLLARALGLEVTGRFGSYAGVEGLGVLVEAGVEREALRARVAEAVGREVMVIPGGTGYVSRLAIATGGAGSMISDAVDAGADALLTGEGSHHTYHEALEAGIDLLYAGHYATETFGVRALAEEAGERFSAQHVFYDVPTGL